MLELMGGGSWVGCEVGVGVWVALALGLFRRWSSDRGGRFEGRWVVLEVGLGLKIGLELGARLVWDAELVLEVWVVLQLELCW